ncbi:uncharacterized protein LOC143049448 [Mytilus galloprovincialis]|uniref:uncharacterized protein LOC143049448 n=1 Tax=Mytilus galloprovincialis TaxID=29158 RepID=UPI003F7C8D8C
MGSSPSLGQHQAQCQVEPIKQAQIPIGCKCGNSKVKWRCENCVTMLCDMCKDKDHAAIGHHIIDITAIQVKISDVKEYQTNLDLTEFLAVSYDNSLWIGEGIEGGFNPFKSHTALQNVKLVGDKVKVISSFNIEVCDIAVTPTNDILLATGGGRLKQIKAGSNKVTESVYYSNIPDLRRVHVTKDGRVIVNVSKMVKVMDTDGKHLRWYSKDENNPLIFRHTITSITSTNNGYIFVAVYYDRQVVVFGKTDIFNIYRGHPNIKDGVTQFYPSSVATTPNDNVIVADSFNDTLHILDNTGHLLTTYKDIGIPIQEHLAITTEGSFTVLYMISKSTSLFKMIITGC